MAAGLGFKTFNTGDVLSASDVNGYLMQGVLVFASTAARDAAITAPAEGQFAFTKDTNSLFYYDGAAWVASGATGDIEGVTAGTGISGGGTSGTVTVTNSMATAIDAKGDLIGGTGADTFARLAVGANDTVLTADSTAATGLKWATPAGGGSGLTLIAEQSYTAAQTVNVNNVFSTTYDNYKIINRSTQASAGSWTMKMRVGGADTSTGYFTQLVYGDGGTAAGGRNVSGTDEWFFGDSANSGMTSMDILSPYLGAETQGAALAGYRDGSAGLVRMIFMSLNDTTSYTGFSLLTPSNANGKISIYGYAK